MKNVRNRNWLIFFTLTIGYAVLEALEGAEGFWKGIIIGLAITVFIGEAYYTFRGRDMKTYSLKDKKGEGNTTNEAAEK